MNLLSFSLAERLTYLGTLRRSCNEIYLGFSRGRYLFFLLPGVLLFGSVAYLGARPSPIRKIYLGFYRGRFLFFWGGTPWYSSEFLQRKLSRILLRQIPVFGEVVAFLFS